MDHESLVEAIAQTTQTLRKLLIVDDVPTRFAHTLPLHHPE